MMSEQHDLEAFDISVVGHSRKIDKTYEIHVLIPVRCLRFDIQRVLINWLTNSFVQTSLSWTLRGE